MRISWIITLPGVLSVVSALAIQKRDADFFSVRTKMHKDMSGRGGDDPNKYFRTSLFHVPGGTTQCDKQFFPSQSTLWSEQLLID
jgi:hypothetical protein